MVRPPAALRPLYDEFVPVRVTDMRGVDLERYRFDTDLTLAVLWMNADGTVYHRYGARDHRGAEQWLSLTSLEAAMRASLAAHRRYEPGDVDPAHEPPAPRKLEDSPSFAKRDKGACIHCHSVLPAGYEDARAAGTWLESDRWRFPDPARLGIDLGTDDQQLVTAVRAESIAAATGLRVGDRLVELAGTELTTVADLMFALDGLPAEGGEVTVGVRRPEGDWTGTPLELRDFGMVTTLTLTLPDGWKTAPPLEFSWRPFKWGFTPAPGFGGPPLSTVELEAAGLSTADAPGAFAFRVQYLVTWGDNRRFGQAAAKAGLRVGDVVVAVTGREGVPAELTSVDHFHAWWRLTREVGETVTLGILRDAGRLELELEVIE